MADVWVKGDLYIVKLGMTGILHFSIKELATKINMDFLQSSELNHMRCPGSNPKEELPWFNTTWFPWKILWIIHKFTQVTRRVYMIKIAFFEKQQ